VTTSKEDNGLSQQTGMRVRVKVKDSDEVEATLALAIVENQMLNGSAIRLDAGQRFAPK